MQVPHLPPTAASGPALADTPAEAVLAATLALMTAHRLAPGMNERFVIEEAVARSLSRLVADETMSERFRAIASRLQLLWVAGSSAGEDGVPVLH